MSFGKGNRGDKKEKEVFFFSEKNVKKIKPTKNFIKNLQNKIFAVRSCYFTT